MAPYRGFGSAVMIGVESTWGTAVARTNTLPLVSWDVKRTREKIQRDHLEQASSTSTMRRDVYVASDKAGGSFGVECSYDDSTALLLKHALGANATTGTGPYTHTMTLASPPTTGLTVEGVQGDGDGEVFEGCFINRATYTVEPGKPMKARYEVIGETSGGDASASTPSYATAPEAVAHQHWGQFTWDSVAKTLVSLEWTIDHNLTDRMLLGSLNTAQPTSAGFMKVTGRITVEYDATSYKAKWLSDTQGDGTITATGSGNNSLALTFQNMILHDVQRSISDAGVIQETYDFECLSDGTDQGFKAVLVNDNSAHTDNG